MGQSKRSTDQWCYLQVMRSRHLEDDDTDSNIYPGASELCDGKDNDCDRIIPEDEIDSDGDGFLACNDCNDQDDTIYPGAPGMNKGKDNNCNGIIDKDEERLPCHLPSFLTYTPSFNG